jgi:hypothetical protein
MEWRQALLWIIVERLSKSNHLLQILSHALACFALKVLSQCHIITTNKVEKKKVNYNHCEYSQLHLVS